METSVQVEAESGVAGLGVITKLTVLGLAVVLLPRMFMGGDDLPKPPTAATEALAPAGVDLSPEDEIVVPTTATTTLPLETAPPDTAAPEAPPTSATTAKTTVTTRVRSTTTTKPKPATTAKPTATTTQPTTTAPAITAAPPTTASTAAPTTTMAPTTTTTLSPQVIARNQDLAVESEVAQMLASIKTQPKTMVVDTCPLYDLQRIIDGRHLVLSGLIPYVKNNTRYFVGWNSSNNNAAVAIREQFVDGTQYKITFPSNGRSREEDPDIVCGLQSRIVQYDPGDKKVYGVLPDVHRGLVGLVVEP